MESEFIKICANLMSDEFLRLKSIEDKIKHFMNRNDLFEKFCKDLVKTAEEYRKNHTKCLSKGKQFLEEGNRRMELNEFESAISLYSNAILNIPYPSESGTGELSLAYSSRSNAFYKSKQYSSALFDANCALELLSTIGMKLRKIHCLVYLDRYSEAIRIIEEIVENIEKSVENQSFIDRLKELKKRISDKCFAEKEAKPEVVSEVMPELFISESIDTFVSSKGRGYVAKDDIHSGSSVLTEQLFLSALNKDCLRDHCNQCLKRVNNQFIACSLCNEVVFCSNECQNKSNDNRFHRNECKISGLLSRYGTYSCIVYKNISRVLNGSDVSDQQMDIFKEKYEHFMLFHDNANQRTEVTETFDVVIAVKLCLFMYFMKVYKIDENQPKEQFIKICVSIVCNIRKVLVNYFGLIDSRESEDKKKWLGDLVVLNGSLFNHSCSPNTVWFFGNQKLNFVAFKDIKAGEELTITYGPVYGVTSLRDRQKILKSKYHFICNCFGCLEESKTVLSLQCLKCNVGPVVCEDISENLTENIDLCLNCGKSYENIVESVIELNRLREALKEELTELEKDDKYSNDKSLESAIDSINSISKLFYSKSDELFSLKKRLSRLCFLYQKFKTALKYSFEIISNFEDKNSFECCLEMSFYSRVYYELLRQQKCTNNTDWKFCLDINQKSCDQLKQFQSQAIDENNSSEKPIQTFGSLEEIIKLKETIITRMSTQFSKLGLI